MRRNRERGQTAKPRSLIGILVLPMQGEESKLGAFHLSGYTKNRRIKIFMTSSGNREKHQD